MKTTALISSALAALFSLFVETARAEFLENIDYQRYQVTIPAGLSLLQALNQATPIREYGRKYHGYTKPSLRWNNRYKINQFGLCEIVTVTVSFSAVVILPEVNASYDNVKEFSDYVEALKVHEIGHLVIGQKVGRKLEQALQDLSAKTSCQLMEQQANSVGEAHQELMVQQNRDYDKQTNHGVSQGASLLYR